MSVNQLITPSGIGLNITCRNIKSVQYAPDFSQTTTVPITALDLQLNRFILATALNPLTFNITPTALELLEILPKAGDFLTCKVKYRTAGTVTVTSTSNLLFVLTGTSYRLKSSDNTEFICAEIGITREGDSGTLRMF